MNSLVEKRLGPESMFSKGYSNDPYLHDVEERAYISRKVSQIKWKPEGLDEYSPYFITGSYDNPRKNSIDLWTYSQKVEGILSSDFSPALCSRLGMDGNVTGLSFINKDVFAYSCYNGIVGVIRVKEEKLINELMWGNELWLESESNCNCLDIHDSHIAAGALNGMIAIAAADTEKVVGTLCSSSIPVHCLRFSGRETIICGSLIGTVSLWDIRDDKPTSVFPVSRTETTGVSSITSFPAEPHMIACGSRNGTVTVFDQRHLPLPIQVFKASPSAINALSFHPSRLNVLFSMSNEGQILLWSNFTSLFAAAPTSDMWVRATTGDFNLKPKVKSLFDNDKIFTNCLDLNKDRLLCGTDNESAILIKSLILD